MDTLPQDTIDDIIAYAAGEREPREPYDRRLPILRVGGLAALSFRLRAAVERVTFRDIRIDSRELAQFNSFLTPARRFYLKSLTFTTILPTYHSAAAQRAESPVERAANDEAYTEAMHSLFRTLRAWETEDPDIANSRLVLAINHPESPSDHPWPLRLAPWSDQERDENQGIHEGRYLHSYIDLLRVEDLPLLHRVKQLVMVEPEHRYGHRKVLPKVPVLLASRMPSLEGVRFSIDDDEKRFPEIRRHNREEMTRAVRNLDLKKLESAEILFFLRRYRNESVSPPELHHPSISDPISSALCHLSLGLVKLQITGVFDASVLQPIQGLSNTPWPNMRLLDIDLHATTPSGDWYFSEREDEPETSTVGRDVSSDYNHSNLHEEEFSFVREAKYACLTPEDSFRIRVNETTLVPVIDAYAEALSVMPNLTSAALGCALEETTLDGDPGWFSIAYLAPCASAQTHPPKLMCPSCQRGVTRQLVTSYLEWDPSPELAAKLRAIHDDFCTLPMVEKDIELFLEEHADSDEDFDDHNFDLSW